jgi:regulator of protease activity HflC (stomatin/prohibitin superfamily)
MPLYNVWNAEQRGRAQLAEAEYSKQVAVQIAKAKQESAAYEAQAEIIRAGGVAKANQIIGESLKNNEDYLRYLWIDTMKDTHNQVIYVPTETNLPILEASRRMQRTGQ